MRKHRADPGPIPTRGNGSRTVSLREPSGMTVEVMAPFVVLIDGKLGAYGIVVPDLPGCTSGAATLDDAVGKASEAIKLWLEDAIAEGDTIPKPRTVEQLRKDNQVARALIEGATLF